MNDLFDIAPLQDKINDMAAALLPGVKLLKEAIDKYGVSTAELSGNAQAFANAMWKFRRMTEKERRRALYIRKYRARGRRMGRNG